MALLCCAATAHAQREVVDFDKGWSFTLGDPADAEKPGFDSSAWRVLDVPHDWAFEAGYAPDAAQTDRGGYKPGGIGWYRKTFDMPAEWQGKQVRVDFDAVYMNSDVWINGHYLGKRPYGYISFGYDLTPYLKPGENTIAVCVDNSLEPSARWYHGCGIYGHVKLTAFEPVHVVKDSVYITTPHVSETEALVRVKMDVVSEVEGSLNAEVETTILSPDGTSAAPSGTGLLPAMTVQDQGDVFYEFTIGEPQLWDTDTPNLYTAVTQIKVNGQVVGEVRTRFGIRDIRWDTATGFWLNGRNVKLRGVCDHLECGPVGAASTDELIRWKIGLLKEMGCNAVRCAHNPQVPAFYDICDEMGMLVMDEIFDGWMQKAAEDYGKQAFDQWWERDLRAWLRRDRNHPCVIIWSLGNETRGEVAVDLVRVCHEEDPTRLTTSGHSGSEAMDVFGVNGHSEKMHFFDHAPDKPFVSTEAPHTWQVRGYYRTKTWFRDGYPNKRQDPFPCPDLTEEEIFTYDWTAPENRTSRKQIFNSSYDNAMVRITARKNWELMRDLPWYAGHFRWTGFDYVGEAGYVHGGWPFRAFMGGALDLAGFKKDLFYFYQSQWTDKPMVHILPHWTHPKMELGTEIPVWVYSNCDEVELFLNGESFGKDKPGKAWDEMQCEWMVPWTPGVVEAVGYRDGKEVARAKQITAGAPTMLKLSASTGKCPIVTVTQTDDRGVMNPYAENRVHYHINGPARILSLESGNPVNTENNFGTTSRTTFFGLGRAFLQETGAPGDITVTVGAICGEKQLMTSDRVSIDVRSIGVRGRIKPVNAKVLYSTDGSEPSIPYAGAFAIKPNTTVKADVIDGDALLFRMSECFGPDEGIHWGEPNSELLSVDAGGDQAEDAKFQGAVVLKSGENFQGRGYLDFGHSRGAYVEWYQENDGSAGEFELAIRYSGKAQGRDGRPMLLTVNGEEKKLFLPNTKGYGTDWQTLRTRIHLDRGANTIRISTIEAGGMNIDGISVE